MKDEKKRLPTSVQECAPGDAPGFLTNHASRVFNRRVDAMLRPHGVPLAHLSPLFALKRWGSMLQRDLLKVCGIAQPAMVHALMKLEESGYIARQRTATDRRAAMIELTPRGEELLDVCSPLLIEANERALAGFTVEEARTLNALLKRLIANIQGESEDEASEVAPSKERPNPRVAG